MTLQAQQPEVNIIRVALQGFAAVAGGTQSLHTNGFDEALALPTERSARIALRTQQVLAYESGAADTVDPFAGSYFIESLTDEIEKRAWELIDKVEQLGGSVQALEFIQREIEESAASYHERYRSGQDIVVGVNKFVTDEIDDVEILRVDPESERRQLERLKRFKESRDVRGGRGQARRPPRGRRGRRQPALPDQGRPARRGLDRRGLRGDAGGVRRVQRGCVLLRTNEDFSFDDEELESKLVWIFGSPRTGSTWLAGDAVPPAEGRLQFQTWASGGARSGTERPPRSP